MFGSTMWQVGFAQKPNDILGFANARSALSGEGLHAHMKAAARGLTRMLGLNEALPNPDNRIMLADQKDEFGIPLARVVHSYDGNAPSLWRHVNEEGLRIMTAAGATAAWFNPNPGGIHFHGGTIMGDAHATSVTNAYGQTHDIPNLWIGGPGLFPTEGAVNPTFTVSALALRKRREARARLESADPIAGGLRLRNLPLSLDLLDPRPFRLGGWRPGAIVFRDGRFPLRAFPPQDAAPSVSNRAMRQEP
ncbi:GMC oxidoreductase [Bradyrhizobium sp. Cp5.3]|uniref:GMC oxidoreductase n=1 Tax=Bradyrhizobium sp. Cp5.3 TaxID=443598 RepID=UPI00041F3C51|nr:GMC oxidoreductase [Bradyrhizobium sp. Cp5.3]